MNEFVYVYVFSFLFILILILVVSDEKNLDGGKGWISSRDTKKLKIRTRTKMFHFYFKTFFLEIFQVFLEFYFANVVLKFTIFITKTRLVFKMNNVNYTLPQIYEPQKCHLLFPNNRNKKLNPYQIKLSSWVVKMSVTLGREFMIAIIAWHINRNISHWNYLTNIKNPTESFYTFCLSLDGFFMSSCT